MPFIPGLQESSILESTKRPLEAVDVTNAGIQDRAIQKLGAGVANFGEGLMEYGIKRREISKKIDVDNFKADAMAKALELNDHAMKSASADGSDITKVFNDQYDEYYKDRLSQIQDPDAQREARAVAVSVRNTMNKDLYDKGRAMFVDYGSSTVDRGLQQVSAMVSANPDGAGDYATRGYDLLHRYEGLLGKDNQYKKMLAFEKDFADSTINGFVNQGRFDDARKSLVEKFGGQFKDADRQAKMDYIDKQQFQNIDRDRSTVLWNQGQAKVKLEETQKANFRDLFTRQENGDNIEEEAARLEGLGFISNPQRVILTTKQDKFDQKVSDYSRANFYGRALIMGQNPDTLLPDVARAVDSGQMSAVDGRETYVFLQQLADKKKEKQFTDPTFKALERDHHRIIGARFGIDTDNPFAWSMNKGPDADLAASTIAEYDNYIYLRGMNTPDGQRNALNIVLKNRGGVTKTHADVPAIIGLDRNQYGDPGAVSKAQQDWKAQYSSGKINQKTYLEGLRKFKQLKDVNDDKARSKGSSDWADYFTSPGK